MGASQAKPKSIQRGRGSTESDERDVAAVLAPRQRPDLNHGPPRACNAGGSASAVRLRWLDANTESTTAVSAFIENTTSGEVVVRPKLRMHSPLGDFRELQLPTVTIPAGQTVPLTVPVENLPVQSAGLPSTATLSIEWMQEEISIDLNRQEVVKSGKRFAARTETPSRYITMANDGQTAAVRELREQQQVSRERRGRGSDVSLSALTLADGDGLRRQVAAAELASGPVAGIGEVAPEPGP